MTWTSSTPHFLFLHHRSRQDTLYCILYRKNCVWGQFFGKWLVPSRRDDFCSYFMFHLSFAYPSSSSNLKNNIISPSQTKTITSSSIAMMLCGCWWWCCWMPVYVLEQWTKSKYEIIWNKLKTFQENAYKFSGAHSSPLSESNARSFSFIKSIVKSICITVWELLMHSFNMRAIFNSAERTNMKWCKVGQMLWT